MAESKTKQGEISGKRAYAAPVLTTYGSVRELTGGQSNSGMADGGVSMLMV